MEGIKIKGYLPTSLIDYPGKIASVIFLPRCNFRCPFCFNIDLVNDSKELKDIGTEEIFHHLKYRKKWLDGVVLTGGEPCLHPGLIEFIRKIKKLGFLIKLDTNGTNPAMLERLIKDKLIDYVAMDIKAPLEKYEKVTKSKVNLKDIQKSVDIIRNTGIDYEFRSTILPKLHSKEDILAIGKWLKGSKRYFLQQFRPEKTLDKKLQKENPYSIEQLREFSEILKPFFEKVEVRGI